MRKLLFLSNGTKPSEEEANYIGEEKLTSFSLSAVKAALCLKLEVTIGVNRNNPDKLTCDYPVTFYNAEIYRNPFNLKEVYKAYKNACKELSKGKYSVIHCNTPIGGLVGRIAGKKCGIKTVIYTAHGFHFYKGAPKLNWLLYYPVEKWLAHYTDALITINQEDYELAKRKFRLRKGGKVYYVPGVGIDTAQYNLEEKHRNEKRTELGLSETDIALISMGDLIKRKNYNTAIQAIAETKNPNLQYFICGKGSEETNLKSLAETLGVSSQIHFLGFRSDIKELLVASDIFLFTTKQEGLPRSMMEAMASGLPCIASRIRGNVDLLEEGKGGYLFDAQDVDEIVGKLRVLSADRELREKMKKENLERIKKFDVKDVKKTIEEIYREVLV